MSGHCHSIVKQCVWPLPLNSKTMCLATAHSIVKQCVWLYYHSIVKQCVWPLPLNSKTMCLATTNSNLVFQCPVLQQRNYIYYFIFLRVLCISNLSYQSVRVFLSTSPTYTQILTELFKNLEEKIKIIKTKTMDCVYNKI